MMLDEYKEKKMQDPGFAQAYNESQPELSVIREMIPIMRCVRMTVCAKKRTCRLIFCFTE